MPFPRPHRLDVAAIPGKIADMDECIHELDPELCVICSSPTRSGASSADGSMAGKTFALVFAPSLRRDTFLHLNREGEHWKLRWYRAPGQPAIEIAQSGTSSTRRNINLDDVEFVYEIAYPYSTRPGGVSIRDSGYWFEEIAKANANHDLPPDATDPQS